jgi:hypothetical protein
MAAIAPKATAAELAEITLAPLVVEEGLAEPDTDPVALAVPEAVVMRLAEEAAAAVPEAAAAEVADETTATRRVSNQTYIKNKKNNLQMAPAVPLPT